jgi:hypothetical protein
MGLKQSDLERGITRIQDDSYSSGQGSNGQGSSVSKSTADESKISQEQAEELAQRETGQVFRLRVLVILVLLMGAVAVSFTTYYVTKNAEDDEFENTFKATSAKVLETFEEILTHNVGAIASLALATVAHGVDHSRDWPFVTLSSFQQRATNARSFSDTLFIAVAHSVTAENRKEWEDFATEHDSLWM